VEGFFVSWGFWIPSPLIWYPASVLRSVLQSRGSRKDDPLEGVGLGMLRQSDDPSFPSSQDSTVGNYYCAGWNRTLACHMPYKPIRVLYSRFTNPIGEDKVLTREIRECCFQMGLLVIQSIWRHINVRSIIVNILSDFANGWNLKRITQVTPEIRNAGSSQIHFLPQAWRRPCTQGCWGQMGTEVSLPWRAGHSPEWLSHRIR